MAQARFRGRGLTALLMLLSFTVLAASGTVLYFAPGGRTADASGWLLVGLTRWQWADLHACFALLMFLAALPHFWMNRRQLLSYLRQKTSAVAALPLGMRFEFLAAVAFCVVLAVATVWHVPAVSYIAQLRSEIRGSQQPGPGSFPGGRHGWRAWE